MKNTKWWKVLFFWFVVKRGWNLTFYSMKTDNRVQSSTHPSKAMYVTLTEAQKKNSMTLTPTNEKWAKEKKREILEGCRVGSSSRAPKKREGGKEREWGCFKTFRMIGKKDAQVVCWSRMKVGKWCVEWNGEIFGKTKNAGKRGELKQSRLLQETLTHSVFHVRRGTSIEK